MNTVSLDVKKIINTNISVRAEMQVLVLSDFAVEYKKIRPVGKKNKYFLIELPRIFLNGHFDDKKKYEVKLCYGTDHHRKIIIDLDNNLPIYSTNNRQLTEVKN